MSYINPMLGMPAMRRLQEVDPATRAILADVLRELGCAAETSAEESWRKRKAPMAAYWRAVGVYARHIARAVAL